MKFRKYHVRFEHEPGKWAVKRFWRFRNADAFYESIAPTSSVLSIWGLK